MRFRFSRPRRQEPPADSPPDSRFADGDSQFADGAATDRPLRLRDALRRGGTSSVAELPAPARLPLIGHLPPQRQLSFLVTTLAVVLALSAALVALNARHSAAGAAATQVAGDALMHSQRIGKAAPNALQGHEEAFRQLGDSRRELDSDLALLGSGGSYRGRSVAAAPGNLEAAIADARAKWAATAKAADTILRHREDLAGVEKSLRALNALAPQLLAQADEIAALRLQRGAGAREIAALGRLTMLTQRMSLGTAEFTAAGGIRSETAFQLGRDITAFRAIVDALLNGGEAGGAVAGIAAVREPDVRERLAALRAGFEQYQAGAGAILGRLDRLLAARTAERLIFSQNESLRESLARLLDGYRAAQESLNWTFWLMVAGGMLTLLTGAAIGRVLLQDSYNRTRGAERRRQQAEEQRLQAQRQEEEARAANAQNQAAILRLMNELQEVADGDLTVQATVSEDITGAIADSVNYTVEELRGLVGRVTATAEQVTAASSQAQDISTALLSASQQQAREIRDTSATVLRMAAEITDVSKSAAESADVARRSVAAARQGAAAVQDAIAGMNGIREQIQETSKRIKRLGESSQQIGEITELISDITGQTNVLALNAAIQAASAGEAGRGFSVVAEEVQRLAERSADSAKQIGALVRTIQADTHDAVAAMERSTHGVVEGARLSDAAGAALDDIERVSRQLAELIEGMSHATGTQAASASGVARHIGHILQATEQAQAGTQQTAQSVRQLSALAQQLKDSVSRFRIGNPTT
ncbi:methyl-accepting chemotaxis protein [Pseudoduganella albidiflava]|uniref:Methyl-accepting chemotaxis protein n=1 Tax=Pseudoduganella albidiflava TaxID=321983 RepID=A0A411WT17_9BURK|nr:methyl-accepting chemotaxis protein [Pseudoduganella albidiflava]QBH99797.1 methyl-accepting chemotaxis protein [Pseudoduganella albidiflava]GGY63134.1 protein PilJ [Pseudoduganella albidiflava]